MTEPLIGVNLGGWLVLEKWMTPTVFAGTAASDEFALCSELGSKAKGRLTQHRDSFIVEADFAWLAAHGVRAVRLPIGYWLFGDAKPFVGCEAYVKEAFTWAGKYQLKILLDVHAVPGSQNGWDHSGRAGAIGWPEPQHVAATLRLVTKVAQTFGQEAALLGIELLNEPKWTLPRRILERYYTEAYESIRQICRPDCWIVISDNFRPHRWQRRLRLPSMYIDHHHYQCFSARDQRRTMRSHLFKLLRWDTYKLRHMAQGHPLIVGEWSLALNPASTPDYTPYAYEAAVRAYAAAQLLTYSQAAAWFFWSYKTEGGGGWSFRDSIEKGWLPDFSADK